MREKASKKGNTKTTSTSNDADPAAGEQSETGDKTAAAKAATKQGKSKTPRKKKQAAAVLPEEKEQEDPSTMAEPEQEADAAPARPAKKQVKAKTPRKNKKQKAAADQPEEGDEALADASSEHEAETAATKPAKKQAKAKAPRKKKAATAPKAKTPAQKTAKAPAKGKTAAKTSPPLPVPTMPTDADIPQAEPAPFPPQSGPSALPLPSQRRLVQAQQQQLTLMPQSPLHVQHAEPESGDDSVDDSEFDDAPPPLPSWMSACNGSQRTSASAIAELLPAHRDQSPMFTQSVPLRLSTASTPMQDAASTGPASITGLGGQGESASFPRLLFPCFVCPLFLPPPCTSACYFPPPLARVFLDALALLRLSSCSHSTRLTLCSPLTRSLFVYASLAQHPHHAKSCYLSAFTTPNSS